MQHISTAYKHTLLFYFNFFEFSNAARIQVNQLLV